MLESDHWACRATGLAPFNIERTVRVGQGIAIPFSRRRAAIQRLGFCVANLGFEGYMRYVMRGINSRRADFSGDSLRRAISNATLILPHFKRSIFHMPTIIATEHGVPSAGALRTAYGFLRFGKVEVILAAWAIAVLLIGVVAYFDARPTFLGAFDVSVAPF
jgi:hypothetical protein